MLTPKDMSEWETEMNGIGAIVINAIKRSPLHNEAATLAALIGVLAVIRSEGLNEEAIFVEAMKATPHTLNKLIH